MASETKKQVIARLVAGETLTVTYNVRTNKPRATIGGKTVSMMTVVAVIKSPNVVDKRIYNSGGLDKVEYTWAEQTAAPTPAPESKPATAKTIFAKALASEPAAEPVADAVLPADYFAPVDPIADSEPAAVDAPRFNVGDKVTPLKGKWEGNICTVVDVFVDLYGITRIMVNNDAFNWRGAFSYKELELVKLAADDDRPTTDEARSKTTAELDALKVNWMSDPCWDIEDTEGFEAHYTELHDWRVEVEQEQERQRNDILRMKMAELNCSKQTAEYVMSLEYRLRQIERRLEKLES